MYMIILETASILLTVASLCAIGLIVGRRFSILSTIDVERLPMEREAQVKHRIMKERLKRRLEEARISLAPFFQPIGWFLYLIQKSCASLYVRIAQHRERIHSEFRREEVETQHHMPTEDIVADAQAKMSSEQYEDAETRFIEVLSVDKKNMDAYCGLAELYQRTKQWKEAEEVLVCIVKLRKEKSRTEGNGTLSLAQSLVDLAEVYIEQDRLDDALSSIKEAIGLQDRNPKFLDALVSLYILRGERLKAERALSKLKEHNPENNKISDFILQIEALAY